MGIVVLVRDLQTGRLYECHPGRPMLAGRMNPKAPPEVPCVDPHVSRRHCQLLATPTGLLRVSDLSTYGTFLNGQRIHGSGTAYPGDHLLLGQRYRLQVEGLSGQDAGTMAAETMAPEATHVSHAPTEGPAPEPWGVHALVPGALVNDRYQLVRELGRGGMGAVFEALDGRRSQPCAIKFLLKDESTPEERFKREALLATLLGKHPAVVRAYDYGTTPAGLPYLVMDLVSGPTLKQVTKSGLPVPVRVELVVQAGQAVAFAHARGVIHRDLKPANILLDEHRRVRLTDFGIAKIPGSKLTRTGDAMGTPNYASPEQIMDSKRVGPEVDVYGLGGILYYLLTGRPPFQGKAISHILRKVVTGALVPPTRHVPDLDPALEAVCVRALKVEPQDRYPTVAAFLEPLEAWLAATR